MWTASSHSLGKSLQLFLFGSTYSLHPTSNVSIQPLICFLILPSCPTIELRDATQSISILSSTLRFFFSFPFIVLFCPLLSTVFWAVYARFTWVYLSKELKNSIYFGNQAMTITWYSDMYAADRIAGSKSNKLSVCYRECAHIIRLIQQVLYSMIVLQQNFYEYSQDRKKTK